MSTGWREDAAGLVQVHTRRAGHVLQAAGWFCAPCQGMGTYVIIMHSMSSQLQDSNSHKQVLPTVHALHRQHA